MPPRSLYVICAAWPRSTLRLSQFRPRETDVWHVAIDDLPATAAGASDPVNESVDGLSATRHGGCGLITTSESSVCRTSPVPRAVGRFEGRGRARIVMPNSFLPEPSSESDDETRRCRSTLFLLLRLRTTFASWNVCRLMRWSCVQRIENESRSHCTKHVVRGKTPLIWSSAASPVTMGNTTAGTPVGGARPCDVRKWRTAEATRGVRSGTSRRSQCATRCRTS
mmetsp:Transcript_41431/g.114036  ORF Transcript_41431/g.114036 Transcript_41431/m.114036 type:complete len:224 (-) Transcript_41431:343-1014(-)|eukprot:383606-Prymnesium_polylepis.2